MKLMLKQYLSSLNERDELDVVLPDILSEIGFNVFSRPRRGTTQYGVDVAATGPHPVTGKSALFLLSIKAGNLTRNQWEDGSQALRQSLDQILEVYIPKLVHPRYKKLPVVIVLCFGGDIQEEVRLRVQGYMEKHADEGRIEFEEWNGDRLADLMLTGILREKMFPKEMQNSFRKALAFVDEPSVCIAHFTRLLRQLFSAPPKDHKSRMRVARQIYLATWNVYAWARDAGNLEAAYQASALAALWCWDLAREHLADTVKGREIGECAHRCIVLHQLISDEFLKLHIEPYAKVDNGLGLAVRSSARIDVNLRVFETLGRVAMHGLWIIHARESLGSKTDSSVVDMINTDLSRLREIVVNIIRGNRVLESPARDDHAIEIMLAAIFLARCEELDFLAQWVQAVARTSIFSYRTEGAYPCVLRDYAQLAVHPKASDGYKEEVTAGSILYPTLAVWSSLLRQPEMLAELADFQTNAAAHCTWQFWVPDESSEQHLYRNTDMHGSAILDIRASAGSEKLIEQLNTEITAATEFGQLSCIRLGYWPLFLLASRIHRLPVPIHFLASSQPADDTVSKAA